MSGSWIFSANGLYDPSITSIGHQPLGFDQLMLFFNHYTVLRSRIKIIARNTGTGSAAGNMFVGIKIQSTTSLTTVWNQLVENGALKYLMLLPGQTGSSSVSMGEIQEQVDIQKWNSIPTLRDNPNWQGTSAGNPTNQTYYVIYANSPDALTATGLICSVLIEYDTLFTEPADLAESFQDLTVKVVKPQNTVELKRQS